MNTTDGENGFDRTTAGQATVALLRRHAPPAPDVERNRDAVMARLPGGRVRYIHWMGAAAAAAASVSIALLLLQDPSAPPAATPGDNTTVTTPAARGHVPAQLEAVVRGASADGWRIDAGLKDGLRVGDRLIGPRGEYQVVAVGIFDARVKGEGLTSGDRLGTQRATAPMLRAAKLATFGGDPGGFYDFGAVFESLPVTQARNLGLGNGRGLRVAETIPSLLRDFDGAPEPTLASRLGLLRGDVIVRANDHPAQDLNQLANALQSSRRSGMLRATVIRNGRTLELSLR